MKAKCDESKLPLWAQQRLYDERMRINYLEAELERLEAAHAVLTNRSWFTIPGPLANDKTRDCYHLFYLHTDGAHPACSLRHGDVLLVGRARSEVSPR